MGPNNDPTYIRGQLDLTSATSMTVWHVRLHGEVLYDGANMDITPESTTLSIFTSTAGPTYTYRPSANVLANSYGAIKVMVSKLVGSGTLHLDMCNPENTDEH